jgi:hypothetical protein
LAYPNVTLYSHLLRKVITVIPSRCWRCLHALPSGRFWRACSWQHVPNTRFTHACAQVLHLCNCQAFVVGYHNDARAFKFGRDPRRPLFFFVLYHSFTPISGPDLESGYPAQSYRIAGGWVHQTGREPPKAFA